jgi:hypothetical protein
MLVPAPLHEVAERSSTSEHGDVMTDRHKAADHEQSMPGLSPNHSKVLIVSAFEQATVT